MPHRGQRNEPAFVARTAARVAEVRGVSVEALTATTRTNTIRLFGLPIA
jgi:TatD DNase family protein